MNSELLAYQYPLSTEAHVCARPSGRRQSTHIAKRPMFIAQNAYLRSRSFHAALGTSARRHTSIRPMPSIP
jgi:hypothetical protein